MSNQIWDYPNGGQRWASPIGPAPEGWEPNESMFCSATIPHNEASGEDSWQNDDLNLDHYKGLHFLVVAYDDYTDGSNTIGIASSLWDAVDILREAVSKGKREPWNRYDNYDISAWLGTVWVKVPNNWRETVNW